MRFEYQAKDKSGNVRTGLVVAETQERAEDLLSENDLTIVGLALVQPNILERLWPFGKGVSNKDMVLFSRQFATLIGAKVPILQTLRILQDQITSKRLRKILSEIVASIESGNSLSLSLANYPNVFGTVYINIVHSGEVSGSLENSLNYLADQLEKDYALVSKVKSAMTYPIFVLSALVVIGALMFLFILPKLTDILEQQGGSLPIITVWLISFTKFFQHYWWTLLIAFMILFFAIRYAITLPTGRYYLDRLKISTPIIGPIFEKVYLARFSRNLSTLILSGIPIIKALQIVSDLVNNVVYQQIILEAAQQLSNGKTISGALEGHKEIPPIVHQMIQVGEQSATLTQILAKLATFYEGEVDAKVATLTTLLEPIIMIVLGLAVGILVAGILLPIYNLASTAS